MVNAQVQVTRPGGPEVLEYFEAARLEEPEPAALGPGEVLVRHQAVGVNFIDCYHRSGLYPLPGYPHGLGMEAAGIVEARHPVGTDGLDVGSRIAYATGEPGAYCVRRVVPARQVVLLPHGAEPESVAASLLKGMTVEYLVQRTYPVRSGESVLLHAAAGGVGLLACQWLRSLGARTIGVVSSPGKAELARQHGCHDVVVSSGADFAEAVLSLTAGAGVSVVYDSVGRVTFDESLRCLRPRGMLVSYGNASGLPAPVDLQRLARGGSLFVTRPRLGDYTQSREELVQCADAVLRRLVDGTLRPLIGQRFPLRDAAKAHAALEARATVGSTLLMP